MEYRTLGRTNLRVSLVGLGTGGVNRLGQSQDRPAEDAYRVVRRALELGINVIDTAPLYLDSEVLLGEALAGVPRDSYVLCTKFQAHPSRGELQAPGALRASVEESLRRLRTDYLDVLYLHGVAPDQYEAVMERFQDELRAVQRDGLTRAIGITEAYERDPRHEALRRALADDVFDVIMVGHNLISPMALTDILPAAERQNVGVAIMCAVRSVISNPDLLRQHIREWKDEGALPEDAVPDDAPLEWVLSEGIGSISAAAYKFAAEHPAASTVLTGTANVEHLEENVRAVLGPPLPPEVSGRLRDTFIPVGRSVLPPRIRMR